MSWHGRVWNAIRPNRLNRDRERELRFHLTERADELQEAGLARQEAERRARDQFGNWTHQLERTRDMNIQEWLASLLRNLRYAARSLAKTPAFTLTVILTLALGIGANSAVFSAIYAVLLRPLPFPEGDRLVRLAQSQPQSPDPFVAPVRLEEWNRLNRTLLGVTGYYSEDASENSGELPERIKRAWVAPRFLEVLGVSPALGRNFSPLEERFGGPPAVFISDRLWRRRFGADPHAVGKTLRFGKSGPTIVGIMPATFQYPDRDVDIWAPSPPDAPYAQNREATWFNAIGRLKPGITLPQTRADLAAVQAGLGSLYPKTDGPKTVHVDPLKEITVHGVRQSLWILFGSVSLLLLIACTNIAALLLSRAAARQHEIAVRFSLGASRRSVAAQLFTEVFVLALLGSLTGLALAAGSSLLFRTLARDLPRVDEISLNPGIVIYSLGCAVAATLLCGIVPVIRATRGTVAGLAQGGRGHVAGRNRAQHALVGVQIALAVILLVGAGLLLRSFQEMGRVAAGFDPRQVLTFEVSSTWAEAGGPPARQRTKRILDGLLILPGIESAAVTSGLPGVPSDYEIELTTAEGRAEGEPKILTQARWVSTASGYFSTMRIPLAAGEMCRDEPNTNNVLVNRTFADRYLNGAEGIGKHLVRPDFTGYAPGMIVGIVADAREIGLDRQPPPMIYSCIYALQPTTYFLVRTHGNPASFAQAVRRKIHEVEPSRSVYHLTPLTDHISDGYAEGRLRMVLLSFFAVTAISLASVGLYGTLSYMVNVRKREVAVCMALGALRTDVVRQFLNQGLGIAAAGFAVGLLLAVALARTLSSMLFGVSAADGETLGIVALLVLSVSLLASLLPAVRAARVEPMRALREE